MATIDTPGSLERRNKWTFGVGTIGRDMVYAFVSLFMVFFLSEVLNVSDAVLLWVSWLVLAARLFDAVMDIVMGSIVDNTRSRWGHYKPWILIGVVCSTVFTVLLFADLRLDDQTFIIVFAVTYLLWGLSWTMNDIPYWAMLPTLSVDQRARERIGSVAKVFASIGLLVTAVSVLPVTNALGESIGLARAWLVFAAALCLVMVAGQCVTLIGVKEPRIAVEQQRTSLKEVAGVVFRNDQLLWTAIAMVIFMTGYLTTTTFGTYFFKYAFGDEDMYSPFAAVLIFSQLIAYLTFPLLRKVLSRRTIFTWSVGLLLVGYAAFFCAPMSIFAIGGSGLLLFVAQGYVTMLMLVFLTDTIDYGHWKLGRRNVGVTFALQPFINKVGAALSTQIVAVTIVAAGISSAQVASDVTPAGLLLMKVVMLIGPAILILISYLIYRWKYRIDEAFHAQIIGELRERGQLHRES